MSTRYIAAQAPAAASPAAPMLPPAGSLWRGRVVLIVGIVLLAITLRHAVTGLSPLLPVVREAMGLDIAAASFLGMLPTLSFGVAGFLAPVLIRKGGAELTAALAMVLAAVGTFSRAFTDSVPLFFVLSVVALFGMGFGNVVGAPLVKKYFPDRQAPMLTVFALLMQAGATLPAMTAVPLANAGGWQLSLASWSVLSLAAAAPWVIQLVRMRRATVAANSTSAPTVATPAKKLGLAQLITSRIAVGTALFYAIASFNTYGMLAWLPTILKDSGLALGDAALAFSAFTFMTLPMAFITPILATRLKKGLPPGPHLEPGGPRGLSRPDPRPRKRPGLGRDHGPWRRRLPTGDHHVQQTHPHRSRICRHRRVRHGNGLPHRNPRTAHRRCTVLRHRQLGARPDRLRPHQRPDAHRRLDDDTQGPLPRRQIHPSRGKVRKLT